MTVELEVEDDCEVGEGGGGGDDGGGGDGDGGGGRTGAVVASVEDDVQSADPLPEMALP